MGPLTHLIGRKDEPELKQNEGLYNSDSSDDCEGEMESESDVPMNEQTGQIKKVDPIADEIEEIYEY